MGSEASDIQQLQKKVKLFEAIVNKTDNGIIVFNDQFEVIFANRYVSEMIGAPANELRGTSLSDFIPKDLRAKHDKLVNLFSVSNDTRQELFDWRAIQCCRQDGTQFPAKITIEKYIISGTNVYITSLIDMTDMTSIQKEKNQVELERYYVQQQKKYATQTLQISLFKNLTKIAKIAQTIKENYDLKPIKESMGTIMNTAFGALSMSQKAIFVSDEEAKEEELHLVDRSLYGSFERIRSLCETEAANKSLNVAWDIPSIAREFKVEQCQTLEQIFYCIIEDMIGNAKFGELTIQLSDLLLTKDNKVNLEFQCSSTRFGVPQHIIDQVLEASCSEAVPRKNNLVNKGMGLRLAHHLTQQLSGKMRIVSHPIEGTKVFLKCALDEAKPPNKAETEEAQQKAS